MDTLPSILGNTTKTQLKAAILRANFPLFVKAMWSEIDPSPLTWGWHMDAICKSLQAVSENRLKKLIISVPPGTSKSMCVSVLWPAFQWARDPSWAIMTGAANLQLIRRDSQRWHDLILSPLYQELYGDTFKMLSDMDNLTYRKNNRGGERIGVSVGSGTALRATAQVIDDPLTVDDARSESSRQAATMWFNQTMSNRFRNQSEAIRIIIAQRLHESDVSGMALKTGEYQHLCLPTEFDPENKCIVKDDNGQIIFEDPRTTKGELLLRFGFGPQENEQAKKDLGSYGYAAQQSQSPVPIGGGMWRREWLSARHSPYNTPGCEATPTKFERISLVVDAAFKGGPKNDKVAMLVVGVHKTRLYILDMVWDNLDFVATVEAVKRMIAKWKVTEVAIEDKANGPAIINQLRDQIGYGVPLIPLEAKDSKEARVSAVSPNIEGGCIVLPLQFTSTKQTVEDFVQEVCSFPFAPHDDATDALAHAINRLLSSGPSAQAIYQGYQRAANRLR